MVVWVIVHSVHSVQALLEVLYRERKGKVLVGAAHYAHHAHFSPSVADIQLGKLAPILD